MEQRASFGTSILVAVFVAYGGMIGGGIGLIGFLIQLWRNQWRKLLMTCAACCYALPLLGWLVTTGV
jgi:hypothetical protein